MISQAAMGSLRMAATLALAVPTLRVRITGPTRPALEVSWMPGELPPGTVHVVPCSFRRSIACAAARLATGRPVDLWDTCAGADPAIEVLPPAGSRTIPPDIHQVRVHGGWRAVFASLLPVTCCTGALRTDWPELGFHADTLTGVTLVHANRSARKGPFTGDAANRLVEARARLLVAELLHDVELSTT